MNEIVYKHKSRKGNWCKIYNCGNFYELHIYRKKITFSKSNRALDAVIDQIDKYGNPLIICGKGFLGFRNGNKYLYPLSRVIYSAYYNFPLVSKSNVCLVARDGNPHNMKKENLLVSNGDMHCLNFAGKKYIILTDCKNPGVFAYTNYKNSLYRLMKAGTWSYDPTKFMFLGNYGGRKASLHRLVVAYNQYGANETNIMDMINKMYEDNPKFGVDHKKSYLDMNRRCDNRICNLQLIHSSINTRKGTYTTNLPDGRFYLPTDAGEIYGIINDDSVAFSERSTVVTLEDATNLKEFCKTGNIPEGVSQTILPITDHKAQKIIAAIERDAALYQEVLKKYGNQKCKGTE